MVFAEPDVPHFFNEKWVNRFNNKIKLGCFLNWVQAANYLVAGTSDWCMICEDDIDWKRDSKLKLLDCMHRFEGVGLISCYTSLLNGRTKRGWTQLAYREDVGLCGALSLTFRREVLRDLLNHPLMIQECECKHLDYTIGNTMYEMGLAMIGHMPTLVRHLGVESSLCDVRSGKLNNIARLPYDPAIVQH